MIEIKKETLITGSQSFNITGGDKIVLKVKDEKILDYDVPAGKTGTITITVNGKLLEA